MEESSQLHAPAALPPGKRAPGTHLIGLVGPRAVLNAVVKKIPSSRRESNPRSPIVQPVAQRYTDWAITLITTCLRIQTRDQNSHLSAPSISKLMAVISELDAREIIRSGEMHVALGLPCFHIAASYPARSIQICPQYLCCPLSAPPSIKTLIWNCVLSCDVRYL
jgi:hypothetical protein